MNGPNKPCECGSGKKQKKCHPFGAPVEGPELPSKRPPLVRDNGSDLNFMLMTALVLSLGVGRGIR